nr:AlpA family phage regulatory protein [Sphingobium subterraneum]
MIRIGEVKRRVGLGKTMIYQKIKEGTFPEPYKLSPFAARWSDREITAWIETTKNSLGGKRHKI